MPFAFGALHPVPLHEVICRECPHWGREGECFDYAVALSSRLSAKGFHGRLIFYRWHIRNTAISGKHVIVSYDVQDGSRWVVDNEHAPKQVAKSASPEQLIFLLAGDAPADISLPDELNRLSYF